MQRYFLDETYEESNPQAISVSGDTFHHMVHVMRMSTGQKVYLVFQDKVTVVAQIVSIEETSLRLSESEREERTSELPIDVTIACGLLKGDKLDWVVQKATELGVHSIIGFPSEWSVVKWDSAKRQKKEQRLQKIAREAAEQSHRQVEPTVSLVGSLANILENASSYTHTIVAYEEEAKSGERSVFAAMLRKCKSGDSLLIFFGPEGGLSEKEIEQMKAHGIVPCALGPRILRGETAPLYALSAISYALELEI